MKYQLNIYLLIKIKNKFFHYIKIINFKQLFFENKLNECQTFNSFPFKSNKNKKQSDK